MRGRVGVRTAVLARGRVRFRAAARGGRARGDARWPRVELAFRWLGAPKKESRKIRVSLLCPLSKAFGRCAAWAVRQEKNKNQDHDQDPRADHPFSKSCIIYSLRLTHVNRDRPIDQTPHCTQLFSPIGTAHYKYNYKTVRVRTTRERQSSLRPNDPLKPYSSQQLNGPHSLTGCYRGRCLITRATGRPR